MLVGFWWVFGGSLWWVFGGSLVGGPKTHQRPTKDQPKIQYMKNKENIDFLVGFWWVFGGSLVGVWWVFGGSGSRSLMTSE